MKTFRVFAITVLLCCMAAAVQRAQASGIVYGSRIFLRTEFEDAAHPFMGFYRVIPKENAAEVVYDQASGNRYLYLDKTLYDDPFCDVLIPSVKQLVVQMDVKVTRPGAENCIVMVRDTETMGYNLDEYPVQITPKMTLTCNGRFVAQLQAGKWYNVAAALDMETRTIEVYLDRQHVFGLPQFTAQNMQALDLVRITQLRGNTFGDLCVDNLMVYEGKRLRDCTEYTSVFTDGSYERKLLGDSIAIHGQSGAAYRDGAKFELKFPPIHGENDAVFIAVEDINQVLDGQLTVRDGSVFARGTPVPAGTAVQDGTVYLNLSEYLETVPRYRVQNTQTGLFLLHTGEDSYSQAELNDIDGYMFFQRPSAEQIKTLFNQTAAETGTHPRLFATAADFARVRVQMQEDAVMQSFYAYFVRNADRMVRRDPGYEPVTYELPDGIRLLETSRRVLDRMESLGMVYQMTGEQKYAERAWQEMEAVFAFPDWNPPHILDTAEMITAVAIGYDWMYEGFTPQQRETIAAKIKTMGLDYIRDAYYGRLFTAGSVGRSDRFVDWPSNFNTVVNGGAVVGAIAVAETDPEFCFDVAEKALRSLESVMPQFAPDGGWEESVNYWGYNSDYFMRLVGALDSSLGTDFGIMRYKGLDKTVQFAVSQESPLGMNNFHDAVFCNVEITPVTWFGKKFQDANAMRYRKFTAEQVNDYRKAYDLLYYDPELARGDLTYPPDWYTRGIEAVSSKSSLTDRSGLFFAAHGGKTSCYHSHPDTGAFVFDLLGERWSEDLGMDTYTPSASAEHYYRKRTEGHSTIVINPDSTAGQLDDTVSPVIWFDSEEAEWTGILDMTAPYSDHAVRAWRGFYVGDHRSSLTIRDEIDLKKDGSTVYWFMQTKAEVDCTQNGAILTKNGKKLRLQFETNGTGAQIQATKAVALPTSPSLPEDVEKNAEYNRVAISYTGSGTTYITVKLSAYDAPDTGILLGDLGAVMAQDAQGRIFEADFDSETALENGWYTVGAPWFSFYDGARIVAPANIRPGAPQFFGYAQMKYRLYLEKTGVGNGVSIGYNPEYDMAADAEQNSENNPYLVYEVPPQVELAKGGTMMFQARVKSDGPAAAVSFRLEDTYGNGNNFVNLVQFREDGSVYCATEATNWSARYLCNWKTDAEYTVTVIFRSGANSCDIYINGVLAAGQFPLFANSRSLRGIRKIYLYALYNGAVSDAQKRVYYDGIKLYSGTEIIGEAYGEIKRRDSSAIADIRLDVVDLERQTAPALLVAEYDEKGALLDVRMALGTGAACETLACRYPMINAGNQLKLFVWKSMEQFIPARPAAAVPAEQ